MAQVLHRDLNVMPLFPNEDGLRIDKGASVATIVEAARLSGESVLSDSGAQRFGGHSLRTGGASMLARWGVNPFRIQSMGRWRSSLVIHYSGSAMSHGITRDAIDSQGGKATGGAAKHVDPRLSKALADADKLLARVESVGHSLTPSCMLHAPLAQHRCSLLKTRTPVPTIAELKR